MQGHEHIRQYIADCDLPLLQYLSEVNPKHCKLQHLCLSNLLLASA